MQKELEGKGRPAPQPSAAPSRACRDAQTAPADALGQTAGSGRAWYFGLLRDAESYRIVASGGNRSSVFRQLDGYSMPTMVVTREDLAGLGIGESEISRWLPRSEDPVPGERGPG